MSSLGFPAETGTRFMRHKTQSNPQMALQIRTTLAQIIPLQADIVFSLTMTLWLFFANYANIFQEISQSFELSWDHNRSLILGDTGTFIGLFFVLFYNEPLDNFSGFRSFFLPNFCDNSDICGLVCNVKRERFASLSPALCDVCEIFTTSSVLQ